VLKVIVKEPILRGLVVFIGIIIVDLLSYWI